MSSSRQDFGNWPAVYCRTAPGFALPGVRRDLRKDNAMGRGRMSRDRHIIVARHLIENDTAAECQVAVDFVKRQEMKLHARFLNRPPGFQGPNFN